MTRMDLLRMIFGFILLVVLSILIGMIAIGHVEEKTSYGLMPLITALSVMGGSFCNWAFGNKGKNGEQ